MFFEYPRLLWLLVIPALLVLHYIYLEKAGRRPHLRVSTAVPWKKHGRSFMTFFRHVPFALRTFALVMVVIAIARPRSSEELSKVDTEGIDIVLAMDVSTSMLARDLTPDRISASKDIAIEFISQRPSDRMGIVVFAGESFTQCPLTTDRATLINLMKEVQTDLIEDGTAIGMGLANAVARLKDSKTKSKVVILLTDGSNNMGDISPLTAAQIAKSYNIRVYTIAIGSKSLAPYPINVGGTVKYVNMRADIDTQTLQRIANTSDGQFYRATNTAELKKIYKDIDKLEKTRLNTKNFSKRSEAFVPFAIAAVLILIIDMLLRLTVFRRLP